ncbi:MAG: FtsX-like permease family protein, partial [Gemmatimonas sp.]|nr:FtsX-like permease family protein [Gemmatimonas sp.]
GPRDFYAFWTTVLVAVCGIALLLSLGGISAVMSYTVAQRTREIGIRVALGSSRTRVLTAVFRRPVRQVALGLVSGFVLLALLLTQLSEGLETIRALAWLTAYSLVMAMICLTACATPTRRALSARRRRRCAWTAEAREGSRLERRDACCV